MNRTGFFLAGALFASGLSWLILRPETRTLERFLEMNESELLSHSDEIEKLQGIEGKMMLALLACVGWKAQSAATHRQMPAPVPAQAPARANPAPGAGNPSAAISSPAPEAVPEPSGPGPVAAALQGKFFCEAARGSPVRLDAASGSPPWLELHPATAPTDPVTREYGVIPQLGEDEHAFLDERAVDVPVAWLMNARDRERSRFFGQARGRAFEGRVALNAQPGIRARSLRAHLHFNGQNDAVDREYLLIDRGGGGDPASGEDILENRVFRYRDAHPAWRFGARSRGIILLNDHCPWQETRPRDASGDPYDLELKELFLVENPRRMLANLYCRKRKERTWVRVGTMVLSPSGSR